MSRYVLDTDILTLLAQGHPAVDETPLYVGNNPL